MSFTLYEVISHLVPGYIIIFLLRGQFGIEIKDMGSLVFLALAYGIGFIIQTLASWAEDLLYLTWGGKPSNQLLNGKDMWKVKFYSCKKSKELLEKEAFENGLTNLTTDGLFEIAMRNVYAQKYDRVNNFNAIYAFSRSLTLAFFVSVVLVLLSQSSNIKLVIILLIVTLVSWYRTKQRGFYYAREVLNMYVFEKTKIKD
jgi:hypothetical protein